MADQSITTDHDRDNLITAHKPLTTMNNLQLASGTVVRGEIVKENGSGALVPFNGTDDVPYAMILADADASEAAVDCVYTRDCSVLGSELVFANGDLDTHRVAIAQNTEIHVEE
jgi:hypothetical protein